VDLQTKRDANYSHRRFSWKDPRIISKTRTTHVFDAREGRPWGMTSQAYWHMVTRPGSPGIITIFGTAPAHSRKRFAVGFLF